MNYDIYKVIKISWCYNRPRWVMVVWWCCGLYGSLLNSNEENSIVLKPGPA